MPHEQRYQRPAINTRHSAIPRGYDSRMARPTLLDWPAWLALIERKRRLLQRRPAGEPAGLPGQYFVLATYSSFRLDGLAVSEREVVEALSRGRAQRAFRSRAAQRVRNHVAILHSIETSLRLGQALKTTAVVRWYTSISSGLSITGLGDEKLTRLTQVARRINSPQLRLQPALQEIARTHAELLSDPLFPSFNGILSRLLLRYHLGRCGLPFAIFNPDAPPASGPANDNALVLRILTALDETYDLLLA